MGRPEETLIEEIRRRFPAFTRGLGIGDDAAIFNAAGTLVITNDLLIEDVDFTRDIPLAFVAEKSLAVNLSDLAAMGAQPVAFLLALGLPRDLLGSFSLFLDSLAAQAGRYAVELIGGDLSSAAKLTISITAFGSLEKSNQALLRSGAREGDRIYLSRPIGASAAGLELLRSGWTIKPDGSVAAPQGIQTTVGYSQREFAAAAIRHHVSPKPEVELGQLLGAHGGITSCIDLSDGLSSDLRHLCIASGRGAVIEWERLPAFPDLLQVGRTLGVDAERSVLHGGEEYALLFTSREREAELSGRFGRPVYSIGRITAGSEILLQRNGTTEPLPDRGFDHFE